MRNLGVLNPTRGFSNTQEVHGYHRLIKKQMRSPKKLTLKVEI